MSVGGTVDPDHPSTPPGAAGLPFALADVRAYVARRWSAAETAKQDSWAHEFHGRGTEATVAASLALWRQTRAVRPEWPTSVDRRDDFEHHVALKRMIDRAARAFAGLSAR